MRRWQATFIQIGGRTHHLDMGRFREKLRFCQCSEPPELCGCGSDLRKSAEMPGLIDEDLRVYCDRCGYTYPIAFTGTCSLRER